MVVVDGKVEVEIVVVGGTVVGTLEEVFSIDVVGGAVVVDRAEEVKGGCPP